MSSVALFAVPAAWDRGDMMDGGWGGWHWVWMFLIFFIGLAFLAVLAVLVILVMRQSQPSSAPAAPPPTDTAHRILAERLARGEINADEYAERLQALDRGSPTSPS